MEKRILGRSEIIVFFFLILSKINEAITSHNTRMSSSTILLRSIFTVDLLTKEIGHS